jgi:hypothetical protein
MLMGPCTRFTASKLEDKDAATSLVLTASPDRAGALLAISEGLMGDPLVIGLFLYGSSLVG